MGPSCSHRLGRLSAVPFRLVEKLKLLELRPRGVLLLKLRGVLLLLLKLLVLRPRGVLLLKLLLLQLPLLLPVQTVLTSLGMEVTTLECRPLTSRSSIKSDNGDSARTSEECDILPTTTTDSMTLRRRPCLGSTIQLC